MFAFVVALSLVATENEQAARAVLDEAAGVQTRETPTYLSPDPEPVKVGDDARVKRFMGALAGGVVGAGAGFALMPLGGCNAGFTCFTPAQVLLAIATPLLTMAGSFVGYDIMGGQGALLATTAAALPAGLILAALLLLSPPASSATVAMVPHLVTGFLVLIAMSALTMDVRQQQLDGSREREAPVGRVLSELGVGLAAAAVSGLASIALAAACSACVPFAVGLGVLGTLGTAVTSWGLHVALRGKGTGVAALIGMGIAALSAAISLPLGIGLSGRGNLATSTTGAIVAIEIPALAAFAFTTLALEWSHAAIVGAAQSADLRVGAAPVPGGGVMAASLRF